MFRQSFPLRKFLLQNIKFNLPNVILAYRNIRIINDINVILGFIKKQERKK